MLGERTPGHIVSGRPPVEWHGSLHRFETVHSTMHESRQLALAGASHGTVVVASEQLSGRGRAGRVWASPPGNLHMTAVLRPAAGPEVAPQLGFVVGVAVAEATDRLAGAGTMLKWPNDVMRGGAKLAGILLERLEDGAVLAGIGLNIEHVPPDMPYPVTCLRALGCPAAADDVLAAVVASLRAESAAWERRGFGPVLDRWMRRGPSPGTELAVRTGLGLVQGRFAGLRADGALLLDTPDGRRALVAGDVQPCAPAAAMGKTEPC